MNDNAFSNKQEEEDGAVTYEWIHRNFRVGFTKEASGEWSWFLRSNKQLGNVFEAGSANPEKSI